MKTDKLYLSNIKECIEKVEIYTQEGKAVFMTNAMMQDAVIRNLEIIGEATKRVSPDLRNQYSNIPWRQMAGLRDVLIHDYLRIDLQEIWEVIETDLPLLKPQVETILQNITE
ncbi:HepT-like ribonuclease domain-containing protein [Oscillatoria acuminata]|uniref:Nucleotidyltransferase n=1 Tax=Oscillatoria acuminata PCC 6304 TaxID=56110 RepID=K9TGK0_9CYAN|nr:DUF86 domain-containing protein [Oscillatoria acuminata]AFY81523.1 hypothetical protein Oscil6304_1850 [Oscillatoria acuminata PCC 6304]